MKKILLILTLFLIVMGTATAVNIDNLNLAPDWEKSSDTEYILYNEYHEPTGFRMTIINYTTEDYTDFFTNNTEDGYIVQDMGNGTALYSLDSTAGSIEVVEIDNNKYILDFMTSDNYNADSIQKTYDEMLAFNNLNDLTPVEV